MSERNNVRSVPTGFGGMVLAIRGIALMEVAVLRKMIDSPVTLILALLAQKVKKPLVRIWENVFVPRTGIVLIVVIMSV